MKYRKNVSTQHKYLVVITQKKILCFMLAFFLQVFYVYLMMAFDKSRIIESTVLLNTVAIDCCFFFVIFKHIF